MSANPTTTGRGPGRGPAQVSYKSHFARFFSAAPDRLHFSAHSHHAWPDVTHEAQERAWSDAAALADLKWEKVFGEVLPAAQRHVARQLSLPGAETIAFAPSTHDLVVRVLSCIDARPIRILTTDSEFHSFERQSRRMEEAGLARVERIPLEPFETFPRRFQEAAGREPHHLVYVSHVFFDSAYVLEDLAAAVDAVPHRSTFIVIDGYHSFMARRVDLADLHDRVFFTAGGYKYAMSGEGACFLHAPAGYGPRPLITGWFAGFGDLETGVRHVSFAPGGARFLGATFDPTALYRFVAVQRWLQDEGITPAMIHDRVRALQARFLAGLDGRGSVLSAETLVPEGRERARGNFLTFRASGASEIHRALLVRRVITDVRGDRLRVGFGLYHDDEDVDELLERLPTR